MVIQRGWKILSDAGSTSASSTEANRSPTGMNSSSDDSNCSNQTSHSMVTSAASPVGNNFRLETNSNNTSNTNNSTTMKYVTTPQMAEMTLQKLRQRFSNGTPLTGSSTESGMRSLELVRIAVQSSFDKKIDELVKQYIETYFKPAFNNIKENLGQGSINEDALQKMSCALLENAKSQYKILRFKSQSSSAAVNNSFAVIPPILQDNPMRMTLKRPAPNKPNATVIEMQKRFFPENMIIKTCQNQQQIPAQAQQTPALILPSAGAIKAAMLQNQPSVVVPLPQKMSVSGVSAPQTSQPRRQIFWNTALISTNTKFVLDVQANQAFGFGPEGKERLASKHPELIRYLPDNEDRDWLVSQQIIPQQNRNSRFLFLIYDEVCRLYQTHEMYKNKSSIDLSVMMTFSVPEFMIQKMKIFFVDLNIKSRGLITNSYSIAGASNSITPSANQGNSHLRNALLLGTSASATGIVVGSPSSSSTISNASSTNTADPTTSTNIINPPVAPSSSSSLSSTSNISSTEGLLQPKLKSSNLSSSHATLTALLNNNTTLATSDKASNISFSQSSTSTLASSTPTLLNKLRK